MFTRRLEFISDNEIVGPWNPCINSLLYLFCYYKGKIIIKTCIKTKLMIENFGIYL